MRETENKMPTSDTNCADTFEYRGFAPLESDGQAFWRWALGAEQSVTFRASAEEMRIRFFLHLPSSNSLVTASLEGLPPLQFSGARQTGFNVFFDLTQAKVGEIITIRLHSNIWNEGANKFSPDPRALAYTFSSLEVEARFPMPPQLMRVGGKKLPDKIVNIETARSHFSVNGECISCGACWRLAPTFIASHELHTYAYFILQPSSDEETKECRAAKEICPVQAIQERV